jgi:hypothetical protein
MNRDLYKLELSIDKSAVIVYRNDNNYGRQGVIFKDYHPTLKRGHVRLEYTPYSIPDYILLEALLMMLK